MPTNELHAYDRLATQVDLVALDAQAVRTSIDLVSHLTHADLAAPTPCGEWTLRELLSHMIAQHNGFASAAEGGTDPRAWAQRPLSDHPIEEYRASAERLMAAFAAENILEKRFALPEINPAATLTAAIGICAHFIDYVVHSWDVAKTLGRPVEFEAELLKVGVTVAQTVPSGAARLSPDAAFGPEVTWSGGSDLDHIVALLGRSPHWPDEG
ncbi:TIGR03086 family metal-binding protein [Fodinicola feengrottensis]|uniref:Mycothiol-dependent maleylpyruvate isomerase metal-binding domain-containing protein n=1 Tax=Fodinicola feengrottensis TaxID=435914 RepID=A0ABN2J0B0_9ACTN|nr:TIGR03086 family metal-binding protein [Fodinicola feengrottensis]